MWFAIKATRYGGMAAGSLVRFMIYWLGGGCPRRRRSRSLLRFERLFSDNANSQPPMYRINASILEVMDPLNFISVVRTAVQFTDFGFQLLAESVRTYKGTSDTIVQIIELQTISRDLTQLTKEVEAKITILTNPSRSRTIFEESLLEECLKCASISKEVLQSISNIQAQGVEGIGHEEQEKDKQDKAKNRGAKQGKPSKTKSKDKKTKRTFREALSLVWNKGKIEEMELGLKNTKSRLAEAMILYLWERVTERGDGTLNQDTPSRHQVLIQQLHSQDIGTADAPTSDSIFTYSQEEQTTSLSDVDCAKALLKDLHFESQESRFDAIPEAYKSTFSWALEESPQLEEDCGKPLWSSLPVWLRNQAGNVYWITGKPGSGKSTIMKYLLSQSFVISCLEEWASQRAVVTAVFYSWNAGASLQKTQIGLLRSLLHQIIEKVPAVAPKIFPGRWAMLKLFGRNIPKKIEWTWHELFQSITSLVSLVEKPFNLAIFVDGLDEFDGDHSQLVKLIEELHKHPRVKVCVSSRPWNDFRDAFADCPHMRMEMLTREDMGKFVQGKFGANKGFTELQEAFPTDAEQLLRAIVEKAQGVFIWVALVTREILAGLTDGDMFPDLMKALTDLPSDLEALYHGLWERVKPTHRHDAARLLLIFQAYTQSSILLVNHKDEKELAAGMPADTMWFADGGRPMDFPYIIPMLTRRLNSRTKGILEISSGRVDYFHRTALEWLEKVWPTIQSVAPDNFDLHLAVLRGIASSAAVDRNWPHNSKGELKLLSFGNLTLEWLLRGFYFASKVEDDSLNCDDLVKSLDDLFDAITVSPNYLKQIIPSSIFDSAQHPDFVILAAELGIIPYVRAKVMLNPRYLNIKVDNNDLLSRLVLGIPRDKVDEPIFRFCKQIIISIADLEFTNTFILNHIAYNGLGRYQLVASFLKMQADGSKGSLAASLKWLDIHRELMVGYSEDKEQRNYGQIIAIGGRNGQPYCIAIAKLFESYGAKTPVKERLRLLWIRLWRTAKNV